MKTVNTRLHLGLGLGFGAGVGGKVSGAALMTSDNINCDAGSQDNGDDDDDGRWAMGDGNVEDTN